MHKWPCYVVVPWLQGEAYQVVGPVVLIADQGSDRANRRLAIRAIRSAMLSA